MRYVAACCCSLALVASARADGRIDAIELRVRMRDATESARNPNALSAAERAVRDTLHERSWMHERWLLAGRAAVVVLEGGGHPLPDRTRIVVHESGDRADVLRAGMPYLTLPPRALGDLMEGGRTWRRNYVVLADPGQGPGSASVWRRSLRYEARTAGWRRRAKTTWTIWHRQATAREAVLGRMIVDLIALPYLDKVARPLLRREALDLGFPTRWRVEVEDESQGSRAAASMLEAEVLSSRATRIPSSAIRAPAPPRYERFVHDAGGQLGARALLGRARSTGVPPGALRVANRTPFHVYVLADGALLGRVGPQSEIRMDGLAAGYYRLYARSRFGAFAWGPRDQYVPGSMTVELP